MLLSKYLPIDDDCPYRYKLNFNTRYFQIGSIAPDLPYASIVDNSFLENHSPIADLFHFATGGQDMDHSPNRIPLLGLERVKAISNQVSDKRALDALFWFVVGYSSHVIADGVCHPYVMDKVGRYEGPNKAEHRALEMGIDVLLLKHFTEGSGHAIEASYSGTDTSISGFNGLKHASFVLEHFAELVEAAYALSVTLDQIEGWVTGISRLFCMSTGKWPDWFRQLDETRPFVFRQIADLEGREDEYLVLMKPKFWDKTFRNGTSVHFLKDCLPRFNSLMKSFLNKAYAYVYGSGPQVTQDDLPAFSLDTGRAVNNPNEIALGPVLWEAA